MCQFCATMSEPLNPSEKQDLFHHASMGNQLAQLAIHASNAGLHPHARMMMEHLPGGKLSVPSGAVTDHAPVKLLSVIEACKR